MNLQIMRDEVRKTQDGFEIVIHLSSDHTEFARELGQGGGGNDRELENSVREYVKSKYPNLKASVARVMLGGILVTTVPLGLTGAASAAAAPADMGKVSDYAKPSVQRLVEQNIIVGDPSGAFNPAGTMNRDAFATMLVKALGLKMVTPETATFKDVPKGSWAFPYVETAYASGLIKGVSADTFGGGQNVTREQMATIYVRALGLSPDDIKGQGDALTFTDREQIAPYARDAVGFAVKNGLLAGVSPDRFAGSAVATREQVAVLADRFLTNKGKLVEAAGVLKAITITATVSAETPNAMAVLFNKAVDNVTAGDFTVKDKDGKTITVTGATLGGDKKSATLTFDRLAPGATYTVTYQGKSTDVVTPAAVRVTVESATALNLREIQVTFGKAVDPAEGTKLTNYQIGAAKVTPEAVTLSDDNRTATLLLPHASALANYSEDNSVTVLKAIGMEADKTISGIRATDTTVPTATKADVIGPRQIKITFNEPLANVPAADAVASLDLDNGTIALDTSTATFAGRTLTINTYTDIPDGAHSLGVLANRHLQDNAGYKVTPATLNFEARKDVSAPTAQLVSSTETSATIKLNKPIDVSTFKGNANVLITHTYNTPVNQVTGTAVTNPSNDKQTFVVSFANPLPPGTSTIYLKYADADNGVKIADLYGNKLDATTFTVTTAADTTAPTVTGTVFDGTDINGNSNVKISFSEDVDQTTALTAANYTLRAADGTIVPVTSAAFVDGFRTVQLTTGTITGGNYTVEVKNVKDRSVAGNVLATSTQSFSATDTISPRVVDADAVTPGTQAVKLAANKFRIDFSEPMDAGTITDKSIYNYKGAALAANDTVEAVNGNKSVIITIAGNTPVAPGDALTMGRVKDASGNWINTFQTTMTVGQMTNVNAAQIQVTGKNSVRLVFDEVITGSTTKDFQYRIGVGGTFAYPTAISTTVDQGKTYITLTTADITDTAGNNVYVQTVNAAGIQGPTEGAKNTYRTPVELAGNVASTDKYAPAFSTAAVTSIDANGKASAITLTFSEPLYVASVADQDFTVEGYTVKSVDVTGSTVVLNVEAGAAATTTPKVTISGELQDAARNTITNVSKMASALTP